MTTLSDHPNPDLLERLPLTAKTILDVGCNTGALGAAFRTINPRVRLFGIEQDMQAAAVAAERYESVAAVDVEMEPLPFGDQRFDCIVYGDVLEHLRNPWEVIARHAAMLNDNGEILVCVPNVEHWTFAARLLQGTWDYEDSGLFDATHLRWFTLTTMRRGLERLGLIPCDVHPRVFDPDQVRRFVETLSPALEALGVAPANYAPRASALQYVWRVIKTPGERMTIAATMLPPVGGVSDVRILYPQAALATDPLTIVRVGQSDHMELGRPDGPSVLVMHRPILLGRDGLEMLRRVAAEGWIIVTEFDDHPDHFETMQGDDHWTFAGVHAVQTSTPALADVLRASNPEVAVFPNAIRALPMPRNFQNPERITLFFGALNRSKDWEPLIPAINQVAAVAGERLHFSVVHDEAFFQALRTPWKSFTPTCDHQTYMSLLGGCEVALMPLEDTPFNRAKSDLKFIEAGACRVAALASPVVYGEVIEDGCNGLIFSTPEEFRIQLLRLVTVPADALAIGDAAREYVADKRMLAYQVEARLAWYRGLWADRERLNRALEKRIARLG